MAKEQHNYSLRACGKGIIIIIIIIIISFGGCTVGAVRRPPPTDPSTGQELSREKGLGWEDGASRSPTWEQHGQVLNDGKVAPTPEPYHSVSAGVSNHSCPRKSVL